MVSPWWPGCDVSNYQNLTPASARALKASGIELVIVRASHEHKAIIDTALAQMQMVVDAGMALHAYGWMYTTEDPAVTAQRWRSLYEDQPIGRFWIDCEETEHIGGMFTNVAWLQEALSVLGKQWELGIYTGKWWWVPYMGDSTAFSNLPLWDANYTRVPNLDPGAALLYGGWTRRAIHQYEDHGSLAGISPLDLDAVDPALLGEEEDMPQVADLINQLGYLSGDVKNALQAALDGARAAKTEADRAAAFDSLQAAINTLERGG